MALLWVESQRFCLPRLRGAQAFLSHNAANVSASGGCPAQRGPPRNIMEEGFYMNQKKKFTVYDMVVVGLMAAVVYVATSLRVEIPTPMGKTMIHMATVACLISGLLFGPVRGGLAGGIGSFFFDIFNGWASSAPFTLVFKFVIGWLAGLITGGKKASIPRILLASAAGSYAYVVLYLSKDFIRDLLLGGALETAIADISVKAVTSVSNGTLAIVVATLLAPALRAALERAGIMNRLAHAR